VGQVGRLQPPAPSPSPHGLISSSLSLSHRRTPPSPPAGLASPPLRRRSRRPFSVDRGKPPPRSPARSDRSIDSPARINLVPRRLPPLAGSPIPNPIQVGGSPLLSRPDPKGREIHAAPARAHLLPSCCLDLDSS
jgi:hypothetical protein